MATGIDTTDHGREAVAAALRERGIEAFEIVERAPLLDHPAGNEAILVRIPGAAPEIHIARGRSRDWKRADHPTAILEEATGLYAHAQRRTRDLMERYANERDRAGIERVLGALAAGETTRERAAEALGRSLIDLVKLEHEFGIHGRPRMVDAAQDMMHDLERMDAEDDATRKAGTVPTRDYDTVEMLRRNGYDDAGIRRWLHLRDEVPLPTPEEIEAHTDLLVYGIEPDAPFSGVTVMVTLGTRNAKVELRASDGAVTKKVAFPRWAGRNAGEYIDGELDRLMREGKCPQVEGWSFARDAQREGD